ncbi:MAG: histidinol-phosphate transaminase [Chloroflexota bacterium]
MAGLRQRTAVPIRRAIVEMGEYVPVRPLEELSRDLGIPVANLVKLDANENPYGCSPHVRAAIAACDHYHIYPDPEQVELRAALSRYCGQPADWLLAGAGSDELIDLLIRLVVEPGDRVLDAVPTFGMYSFLAPVQGGVVVPVPRRSDFSLDLPALLAAIDDRTRLLFVASPNNPTANLAARADIVRLLETGLLVVVDEAYYEFSGETLADLVTEFENLVVMRTFSKWAGLAGLRVGYIIAAPSLLQHLWKMKQPYNVSVAAQVAARAAVDDLPHIQRTINALLAERRRLMDLLQSVPYLRPLPSSANFIFCPVEGRSARSLRDELRRQGILIRFFDTPLLRNAVRVSVGKPEHTERLRKALAGLSPA